MSHITTKDGVKLHVKEWGQGRPVIMAHGWPLSADTFDDLSLAVADAGMRAISYDRRDTSGRQAAKGIAQAKLIEYDNAPHGLFASHKDRLIADVIEFLDH